MLKLKTLIIYSLLFAWIPLQGQSELVDMADVSTEFDYEIRYATPNNFIGEILYDCAKCLLQPDVADALAKANQYFCERGYKIKLYDCYRPLDVQKKMWSLFPRPTYVANPYGKGSIHNKGAAVDISLVTLDGCFVDMGTDYDYFGREAHIDYYDFSEKILSNRRLLMEGMRAHGFKTIRSEWWHYSFQKNRSYPTLNDPLPCD
ncbi:MAG: M15 family metallopeptidase [Bacteroidia bacterium]|nr:M15 family metallopeptidase [Bacteroidia bacterium]NNM24156.1 M15 family metallopeptidase [Flavobacteriaceae bacterium]